MKRYIGHPRVEGTASRQAHADLPPGTYEREMSKEGFFGPAAFFHHRHPPTGWSGFEGPLSPHAFDFTKLDAVAAHPWSAPDLLFNASVRIRFWRTSGKMDALARNADGDELLFVHQGRGELYCDFGRLAFETGDYVVLPRGTMWRLECAEPAAILMIEATNASYMLPEKGLVGGHAIFDPAMLDAPRVDEAFLAQQDEKPWRVAVKRRGAVSTVTFPHNPLDAIGWHGDLSVVPHQRARHPPADEPPLSPAAVGAHDLRRQPLRRLHLRAAAVRDRSRRDQDPVLPQQRRLRRGASSITRAISSAATTSIPAW